MAAPQMTVKLASEPTLDIGDFEISAPLGRKADALAVSTALSTEDVALLTALNTVLGLTTNAAVVTDADGTINAHLRGALVELIAILAVEGATGDAAVAAGATGSISAKLRAISRDIVANIVLAAGSAIIGKVGIDQTTPGTTDSVTLKVGAAASYSIVGSAAAEASRVLKSSAGTLISLIGYNGKTSAQFIQIHNTTAVPSEAAVPIYSFVVPASSNFSLDVPVSGAPFTTGICVNNSSTQATKTLGAADCWFTAVIK